ncbi:MAG: YdeI/OmpD-associated family protein [Planctomycetes bacterium]|nr:YdeI/OmpD-associated family protein [Planctomycetota bacterium]MCD7897180.1 YdeI/OmpD-associated family protein [Planctomycetaceae bacterium]
MSEPLEFPDRAAFRAWLEKNGRKSPGVWLLFGKKGGPATLSATAALEEALCFGWIDGQMQSIDNTKYKKYFARRRATSQWSEKNKKLVQSLLDRGLVAPPGLDAINNAKKRGAWDRSARIGTTDEQVREFIQLLEGHEPARSNLLSMSPSVRKTYAGFYFDAKQDATRESRLHKIVDRLNDNLKPM